MIVRKATEADAVDMAALLNEIIQIGGTTAFQKETSAVLTEELIKRLKDVGSIYVAVDETNNELLGYQSLDRYSSLPKSVGVIATFAKAGTIQRGIGTALFNATKSSAKVLGFTEIDATIRADNTGGLAFYTKMGFKDFKVFKDVPLDDGTHVDRISKRLKL